MRPDVVNQHAHLYPAANGLFQRIHEALSVRVVIENVGAQRDRVLGRVDGLEHGWIGLLAILKRFNAVARQEPVPGPVGGKPREPAQMTHGPCRGFVRVVILAQSEMFAAIEMRPSPPQSESASLNPVDAEKEV